MCCLPLSLSLSPTACFSPSLSRLLFPHALPTHMCVRLSVPASRLGLQDRCCWGITKGVPQCTVAKSRTVPCCMLHVACLPAASAVCRRSLHAQLHSNFNGSFFCCCSCCLVVVLTFLINIFCIPSQILHTIRGARGRG